MKAINPQLQSTYMYAWPELAGTVRLQELGQGQGEELMQAVFRAAGGAMKLTAGHQAEGRLRRAFFELRSWERTLGSNAFALGYPLYTAQVEGGKPILAPLFCWTLNLAPAQKHNEGWAAARLPEHRVFANPYLLAYWREEQGEDLSELFRQFLRLPAPTERSLSRLCTQIAERLGLPEADTTSDETADETALPTHGLLYEGLLGLFPNPNALMLPKAAPSQREQPPAPLLHPCSPIVLGPYQATAAYRLQHEGKLWAEGHAATGKTALGRHLVHNALDNGQSCLVVAPRVGALREYEQSLEQAGLGKLAFLLRDTAADQTLFLSLLRASAREDHKPAPEKLDVPYQQLSGKINRLLDKLRKPYEASRRPLNHGDSWMETVGQYLASAEQEGKELLSTQLSAADYDFSEEEYESLTTVIESCYQLFTQTYTLRSALSKLSPSIFLRMEKAEAKAYVDEQTATLLDKAARLQHWYINRQNAYTDQLMAHFEQYYQRFARQMTALGDRIAEHSTVYGNAFREGGAVGLKVKSVFSGQAKNVLAAREQVLDAYEALQDNFERNSYFDFAFPSVGQQTGMPRIEKTLAQFEEKLQRWRMSLRETVQDEVNRLSRKSVNPQLGFEQQAEELEESLDRWVEAVNETGLYHLPLNHKMLTIPRRQRYLEDAMEQLATTRRALPEFENFYDWQSNWLQLDEKARRLVKALLKMQPGDWQAAYRTWFLDNVLNQGYEAVLPPEEGALEQLWACREQLLPLMTTNTLQYWGGRRTHAFKSWRRRDRRSYQQLINPAEQSKLSTIGLIREAGTAVRAACPALLMNVDLALECFHGQPQPFGLVIVEEAASVPPVQLEQLLALGKRVLFLSPRQLGQAPAPPAELAAEGCGAAWLAHYYQRTPGNLQQAAQGAIRNYGNTNFYFEQLDGRYDEASESNEEEVLRLVSLLNQIEQTPQRTFPSVGIVCMTKGQRDKLSDLLLGIKQRRSAGVETIQQLERNGLTILRPEELGGQHFDVLIVSTTFGPAGLDGEMTAHYHRLETAPYQQYLLQLMSRARHRLMVLNSLPQSWLDTAAKANEITAENLWPAYLAYLRACAQAHGTVKNRLSRAAQGYLADAPAYPQPMALLEAVRQHLRPYLSGTAVAVDDQAPLGEPPVVVGHPPKAAILPDGFLGLTPQTGFFWEYEQRTQLGQRGWSLLSTWSPNWWRNANLEVRQLAAALLNTDVVPASAEEE